MCSIIRVIITYFHLREMLSNFPGHLSFYIMAVVIVINYNYSALKWPGKVTDLPTDCFCCQGLSGVVSYFLAGLVLFLFETQMLF